MEIESPDPIQIHILGMIRMIMNSYNLTTDSISWYDNMVSELTPDQLYDTYDEYTKFLSMQQAELHSDETDHSDGETEIVEDDLIYVTTRREFCTAMGKGLKICPRYSTCTDRHCKNFHIEPQYICPHVTRGSYCDQSECELIVIRPCRKGKHCNDPKCSFKH